MDYIKNFEIKRNKYMPIFPKATGHPTIYRKVQIYLQEMGAKEYFIHQPDPEKPAEFRGWYRDTSGEIIEMTQDTPRTLFSERLNLLFTWKDELDLNVRLLRPYLPDGTLVNK